MATRKSAQSTAKSLLHVSVNTMRTGSNLFLQALMIGMAIILGLNIVMRFFLDLPIAWSNTISRYAYIYIVLLGSAISYLEGTHAKIDLMYDAVPDRFKTVFNLIHYSVMIFLSLVLIVMGMRQALDMWHVHSPALRFFPIGMVYLSVPLSAVIMLLFLMQQMITIKDRKKGS